jgi:hypothetical protein
MAVDLHAAPKKYEVDESKLPAALQEAGEEEGELFTKI